MMLRWSWRRVFRLVALVVALAGVAFWLAGGAHRGWTRTSVAVRMQDEVTGLEAIRYERRFVPGVDFLAAVLGAAGLVAGVSCLFRKDAEMASSNKIHERSAEEL